MENNWIKIVKGKKIYAPSLNKKQKKLHCLRAECETILDFTQDVVRPCTVCKGLAIKHQNKLPQLISDIQNNKNPIECSECYKHEEKNKTSHRIKGNEIWLENSGNNHFEISYSTQCSKNCLYCNNMYSSNWKNIIKKHGTPPVSCDMYRNDVKDYAFDEIENDIIHYVKNIAQDHTKLACMGVYGGEPSEYLLKDNHIHKIVETFYNHNDVWNRRLRYDICTHLSFDKEKCKNIVNYLKNIKDMYPGFDPVIQASCESIEENYEFLRNGNSWKNFKENFDYIMNNTDFGFHINTTINNVSITHLKKYLEFFCQYNNNRIFLHIYEISQPQIFKISLLDKSYVKYIDEAVVYFKKYGNNFKNSSVILKNLDTLRYSIGTMEDKIKYANEALKFYSYIEKTMNKSLQNVEPELYNYLLKISSK